MELLKRTCILIIKVLYLSPFFAMSIWLLNMLYFSHSGTEENTAVEYLGRDFIMVDSKQQEPVPHSHFHITDDYVERMESDQSLCMKCHGIYPHIRDIRTMAIRNMHTGFMVCEVCHIRGGTPNGSPHFAWVGLETGEITMRAEGGYGKYNAKIVPLKTDGGNRERLDELTRRTFEEGYGALTDKKHSPEQQQAEVKRIHDDTLTDKPVTCLECHRRSGYMDFAGLGFPKGRVNQLVSSEVSRMVEHYDTFFMPKMLILR